YPPHATAEDSDPDMTATDAMNFLAR
ncbi:hypothetical protein A2U01_0014493, partial [Trifolium medium]|nr:hypothetical protein [Trifolium medium]